MVRDQKLWFSVPFNDMHTAMHPNARGTIVNIPPVAEPRGTLASAIPSAPVSQVNEDLLGIFDSMVVSKPSPPSSNPFDLVPKPDPPVEVTDLQPSATQQSPREAPTAAVMPGSAQAPINVDSSFQPTIVPIPTQSLPPNNLVGLSLVAPTNPQPPGISVYPDHQVVRGHHEGYNQAGYGYVQPSTQSLVQPGQGLQYAGSHPNHGQSPPHYQAQTSYANGMLQTPQQPAPPKSSNPFDPFA